MSDIFIQTICRSGEMNRNLNNELGLILLLPTSICEEVMEKTVFYMLILGQATVTDIDMIIFYRLH